MEPRPQPHRTRPPGKSLWAARSIGGIKNFTLGVIALTAWGGAVWGHWMGWLPTWALAAVSVSILWLLALGYWLFARRRESEDALTPWREFTFVHAIGLSWNPPEGYELTVQLGRDHGDPADSVTLRFQAVTQFSTQQVADWPIRAELLCADRGPNRRDGQRFKVYDRHREGLEFCCRSMDHVPPQR